VVANVNDPDVSSDIVKLPLVQHKSNRYDDDDDDDDDDDIKTACFDTTELVYRSTAKLQRKAHK